MSYQERLLTTAPLRRLRQLHQYLKQVTFRSFTVIIIDYWLRTNKATQLQWYQDLTNIIISYLIILLFYGNNCIIINDFNRFVVLSKEEMSNGGIVLNPFDHKYFKQNKIKKIQIILKKYFFKCDIPTKHNSIVNIGYNVKYYSCNNFGSKGGTMRFICCLTPQKEYVKVMLDDTDKDIKLLGKIKKLKFLFEHSNSSIEVSVKVKLINGEYYSAVVSSNYKSVNFFVKYQSCMDCELKFNTKIV